MPGRPELTIDTVVPELRRVLADTLRVVLVAPPGAGKTTVVPLALSDCQWLQGRKIVILEPRRVATRAAARRMAALLGEAVGDTVGYRIRQDRRVGRNTRIEVVTEGVLTRRLQSDPMLTGIGLVIFDEFHERSIHADLGLALTIDVQRELRQDLRLLIMSATLDAGTIGELLETSRVITAEGKQFPVEKRYLDHLPDDPVAAAATTTVKLLNAPAAAGDVLVFLPGAAEIRRVQRLLNRAAVPDDTLVCPLYGRLPADEQDRAIQPAANGRRKVVLSTALAETSLTIEGVRTVVDSGLMRVARYDAGRDMTRLVTIPVTVDAARQRCGRAGRTAPGSCWRMWSRHHHQGLQPARRPEILEDDLCQLALELALWGVRDPSRLNWVDPPPVKVYQQAVDLLAQIGALDDTGHITPHGRRLVGLPLHPRLGHMILTAGGPEQQTLAVDLAVLLTEGDPLWHQRATVGADLTLRLDELRQWRQQATDKTGAAGRTTAAGRHLLAAARDLRRRLDIDDERGFTPSHYAGALVAKAYPQRIAQRRTGKIGEFLLAGGKGAVLSRNDPLSTSAYLAVAHLDGGERNARIFLAAAITPEQLHQQFAETVKVENEIRWIAQRDAVVARSRMCLGALVLNESPLEAVDSQVRCQAILEGIRRQGLDCLQWDRRLRNWQARVALVRTLDRSEPRWPDTSEAGLLAQLERWLAPELEKTRKPTRLSSRTLQRRLAALLDWRLTRRLDHWAPEKFTVPSGSAIDIDYCAEPSPVLAVRLQEMFGCRQTPTVAGGRLKLTLHLLSPAGRPVQITDDLPGFWQRTYPEVRRELKGRYPKHAWPEDPLAALPLKGVPRRRKRK